MKNQCSCVFSTNFPHRINKCFLRSITGNTIAVVDVEEESVYADGDVMFTNDACAVEASTVNATIVTEKGRIYASSVELDPAEEGLSIEGVPFREEVSTTPMKQVHDQIPERAAQATRVERVSCENAVREDRIPCACTLSILFPHQQGSCELVSDRAQTGFVAAVAVIGTAIIASAVAGSNSSPKKKRSK